MKDQNQIILRKLIQDLDTDYIDSRYLINNVSVRIERVNQFLTKTGHYNPEIDELYRDSLKIPINYYSELNYTNLNEALGIKDDVLNILESQ